MPRLEMRPVPDLPTPRILWPRGGWIRRGRVPAAIPVLILSPVLSLILSMVSAAGAQSREQIARGKYIFGAAAGCGCHTVPKQALNAGGRKYDGPFGTVYSSNITADPATGIGKWTDEQIITATRAGRRPNGERLIPVHPYTVFNGMAEEDLKDVVAYLRSVPPVRKAAPVKRITVPLFESVFLPAWLATFAPREMPPAAAPTSGVARGEYLARAVGHCGECHTPRTMTMAVDNGRFLAGNQKGKGPEGSAVPNITPDRETGIGSWSEEQITDYLETGNKPDGDVADGLMMEVIQGTSAGYKDLTKGDRQAIAKYLKSIPPVKNRIE